MLPRHILENILFALLLFGGMLCITLVAVYVFDEMQSSYSRLP
jgi:hypothetical protein